MRHVTDDERRARLGVRHGLAPGSRLGSPEEVTQALGVLHATEPATVYLSCWARTDSVDVDRARQVHVDRALYVDRTLVKQLAMRRTLFVFPRTLLPAVWPSASARVADAERARMTKDVINASLPADWLDSARTEILAALADGGLTALEVRAAVPMVNVKIESPATAWSAPRVLTHLGATGDILRGANTGRWNSSRPRWTLTSQWLGEAPPWMTAAEGYRELVRVWLRAFGPGTEADIVWWLGSTKSVVRTALAELEAVAVSLDDGQVGWLLPDDAGVVDPGPWVALLPVLDPTVMGWQGRDFYLGRHRDQLFDTRGNAGTTAWVDGRIVGCWVQDTTGVVEIRLLERSPRPPGAPWRTKQPT
ncbi:winged helix DNA-binding domain-containing protein [Actinokineospora globicatena]|uniref:Winged helix DNA-binding domain-containing protein n=1 Tax=Actinokineospora globicatena TaxID=103729 RepID=A0A9W6QJ06_9PSEU|nr:winged helix DNA-binding domain-containing protein [Actinokineospora globicatena]GLW90570.1 hypothetical protein Aglo03_13860 [Actinokineospora globicatena]